MLRDLIVVSAIALSLLHASVPTWHVHTAPTELAQSTQCSCEHHNKSPSEPDSDADRRMSALANKIHAAVAVWLANRK